MLNLLKRCAAAVLTAVTLLSALPGMSLTAHGAQELLAEPYSLTPEELIGRIGQTYDDARALAGRRNFKGKCSTLVNCSTMALGIQDVRYDGDGRDEYELYDGVERTDRGYDVIRYPAEQYDLESALNAITENGSRDVYNIIVCFEGGRTATSSAYGHTCFIHGIVDGVVYYCESYDLYLGSAYYGEGDPIVCSIEEFAGYYDKWAYFEGAIHLDFPDETPPELTGMEVIASTESSFTLCFRATDDQQIRDIYARVWLYGQTEDDAVTVPVTRLGTNALIQIDSRDFGGFTGMYYVNCYAVDRKGNLAVTTTVQEGISLYQPESTQGIYRVLRNNTGIHNSPYVQVNGVNTRIGCVNRNSEVTVVGSYVNDDGAMWYLLADGGWICGTAVEQKRELAWTELWELMRSVVTVSKALNGQVPA